MARITVRGLGISPAQLDEVAVAEIDVPFRREQG